MSQINSCVTSGSLPQAPSNSQITQNKEANNAPENIILNRSSIQIPSAEFSPQELRKTMEEMIDRLNELVKDNQRDLSFGLDKKINKFIIVVKNTNTGEVVRQIPSEEAIKVAHCIEDMKGLLFNTEL